MHLSRRPSRSPDSKLPGITVRFCTTRLDGRGAFRAIFEMVQTLRWPNESRNPPSRPNRDGGSGQIPKSRQNRDRGKIRRIFPIPAKIGHIGIPSEKISLFFDGQNRHCRLSATGPASAVPRRRPWVGKEAHRRVTRSRHWQRPQARRAARVTQFLRSVVTTPLPLRRCD
jgi:hypothetical protein